jgi:hypothetical protein
MALPTANVYGYGPRRRPSQQLVILWVAAFLGILFVTWWLTSGSRARSVTGDIPGRPKAGKKAGVESD